MDNLNQKQVYLGKMEFSINKNTKKIYATFIPKQTTFIPINEEDIDYISQTQKLFADWVNKITSIEDINLFDGERIEFKFTDKKSVKVVEIYLITS